jgi:hypothetical protein
MDCVDDDSAIQSARRLVESHDVELWQMDRPVARFDARQNTCPKYKCVSPFSSASTIVNAGS